MLLSQEATSSLIHKKNVRFRLKREGKRLRFTAINQTEERRGCFGTGNISTANHPSRCASTSRWRPPG